MVLESASVCDAAEVFDYAQILGDVRIRDSVKVFGSAKLMDYVVIKDSAQISGRTFLNMFAVFGGNALVFSSEDWFYLRNIGEPDSKLTFFNCEDGTIKVSTFAKSEIQTLDNYKVAVFQYFRGTERFEEHLLAIQLVELHLSFGRKSMRSKKI